MATEIGTKKWMDWNVGKGRRFENLNELLTELIAIMKRFGHLSGYAGGNIMEEILIVEDMIKRGKQHNKQ